MNQPTNTCTWCGGLILLDSQDDYCCRACAFGAYRMDRELDHVAINKAAARRRRTKTHLLHANTIEVTL